MVDQENQYQVVQRRSQAEEGEVGQAARLRQHKPQELEQLIPEVAVAVQEGLRI